MKKVECLERRDTGKVKVYFWPQGENVLDNVKNRHRRPSQVYKEYFSKILKSFKLPLDLKYQWSQTAGCSCGCSPGFVLAHKAKYDIHVTYR